MPASSNSGRRHCGMRQLKTTTWISSSNFKEPHRGIRVEVNDVDIEQFQGSSPWNKSGRQRRGYHRTTPRILTVEQEWKTTTWMLSNNSKRNLTVEQEWKTTTLMSSNYSTQPTHNDMDIIEQLQKEQGVEDRQNSPTEGVEDHQNQVY